MRTSSLGKCRPRSRPRRPGRWLPRRVAYYWVELRNSRWLLLQWQPFIGIRPLALRVGPLLTLRPIVEFVWRKSDVKKKAQVTAPKDGPEHLAAVETNVWSAFAPLVAHCAVTRYDDGDPRKPGWLTIKTQGSSWIVQVKDPDSASSFQAVAVSLDDALSLASVLLEADSTPWEHDPWLAAAARGKKK